MGDEKYETRKLRIDDFENGFIDCINQLTEPKDVSKEEFERRFKIMVDKKDYHVIVIEDKATGKIVASGTLFVEYKFIRGCVLKGHIEDVVVVKEKRGCGLGKLIVNALISLSQELGCYKTSLVCENSNKCFYSKCGFHEKETEMVIYN